MRSATLRRSSHTFLATLTYDFDRFDTVLNGAVLLAVSLCLMVTAFEVGLGLSALFWLPFALFAGAVQILAGVLFGVLGFSLVWCALFGLALYEEVRWRRFSSGAIHVQGLAALATVLASMALVLYAVEELVPQHTATSSCAASCWSRCGSTLLHGATLLLAALLTLAADSWHGDRRGAFFAAFGASALLLLCTPLLAAARCHPGKAAVRVQPVVLSAQDMAVALLQEQLMRTRDRISVLRAAQMRRIAAEQAADETEAAEIRELEARERTLLRKIDTKAGGGVSVESGYGDCETPRQPGAAVQSNCPRVGGPEPPQGSRAARVVVPEYR